MSLVVLWRRPRSGVDRCHRPRPDCGRSSHRNHVGVVGFELMETQKFGVTQFQERLNFQRGLEGELTRSIQALSGVESARVHLALPNQNGFFREQQKASASVVLTLYPGRTLDRGQLATNGQLVERARKILENMNVSVMGPADVRAKLKLTKHS